MGVLVVVPDLASSSAFSLPQCPEWAAIHLSSSVLLAPRRLRALRQLMTESFVDATKCETSF